MEEKQARMLNPLQLAYIGDTVWDLLVRSRLIYRGRNVRNMHKDAVACVNARAQALAVQRIEAELTEPEADVFRRGRNAHAHHAAPKNQEVADYRAATGLEALVGYLYLTGQEERLLHLFALSQEESTCPVQQ
ncbi:MAG: Mini-ribonuclease 3 [Clostridia bacterium]|nr:Mini-ribonuclease 3 [Clostridia bacterium]